MAKLPSKKTKNVAPVSFGKTLNSMIRDVHEINTILCRNKKSVDAKLESDYKKIHARACLLAQALEEKTDELIRRLLLDGYDGVLSEALEEIKN